LYPHEAEFSQKINVGGTERVIEACHKCNVQNLIVTSTSNSMATASSCWIGMDESKTLVTRETSHNHYGWTKAIADKMARDANGTKNEDGSILKAAVIRPCSAVFGAGDGINVEVTLLMKVAIIVDPKVTMDWVYVDNVVQGHLLCEEKLRTAPEGVAGEAFCIPPPLPH
jgi:nucleoside-diphosphate-sugar epimerase